MTIKIRNQAVMLLICICFFSCETKDRTIPIQKSSADKIVPSYFDNGDRIFFRLPTISGDTIQAYTDTGGGWTVIYPWKIEELKIENKMILNLESNQYILAQDIFKETIYHPAVNFKQKEFSQASLFQIPSEDFLNEIRSDFEGDAFFGQFFFINHCWTFDYLNEKVIVRDDCNLNLTDPNTQTVGFKKDDDGNKLYGHPSMYMKVDGDSIPMLLDTGATFTLSDSGEKELNTKSSIGGSFIAQSIYEKWIAAHPDWKVISGGAEIEEGGNVYPLDMIEVPKLMLGTYEVGPVWFSVQPDRAWSKFMIKTMDKVVKGALGGSALKYVSVTIDYPNEKLSFNQ